MKLFQNSNNTNVVTDSNSYKNQKASTDPLQQSFKGGNFGQSPMINELTPKNSETIKK